MDQENIGQTSYNKGGKDSTANDASITMDDTDRGRPADKGLAGDSAIFAAAADAMADRERQMTYDARLTHAIWELATTGANPAVDLLVCLERRHTIGFRYVDITRPVVVHHGSRDTRVPVENVRWLGKTMRRCEVRVLEGEGHGLMASASVMGAVLMEISKEWEDWMRVTGADGRKERERGRRGTVGRG
jgi:pimeloyl-ACP methyl ester carboxylesterase